jgi:DNA-binding IclR family transcriptional regulator
VIWSGHELGRRERLVLQELSRRGGRVSSLTLAELAEGIGSSVEEVGGLVRSLDRQGLVLAAPSRYRPEVVILSAMGERVAAQ